MDALSVSSTSASTTPCDATARPMSSTTTGAATTSTVPTGSAPAMRANPNPWDPDHAVFNATKDELKGCRNSRSLSVLLLARPTPSCCRSTRRAPDSGPRSHPARAAAEEGAARNHDTRQGTTTLFAVLNVTRLHGHRPQHAASSSSAHSISQRRRGGGSGRQDHPRHSRQLCGSQTPQRSRLA
jgi:hypothetical protein